MIRFDNVTKIFKQRSGNVKILDNVSLELPNTGFIALCGRSGCGKTTLLNMIAGNLHDYSGTIYIDNVDITNLKGTKRNKFFSKNIFYLRYNNNFIKSIKVKECISLYLNKKEYEKCLKYIDKYEIQGLLNKKVESLSSGELQKVGLCISLSKDAKILILDEPICNIDSLSISGFINEIKEKSKKCLVIYVSHMVNELENICDMKLRMYEGKICIEYSNTINKGVEFEDVSCKFTLRKSFICEKSKPFGFYFLFRIIVFSFSIFILYFIELCSYESYNVIVNHIDKMSLNIVETELAVDNEIISEAKIYYAPMPKTFYSYPYKIMNIYGRTSSIEGFGKASDFKFYRYSDKLEEGSIIISSYLAGKIDVQVGDEVRLNNATNAFDREDGLYYPYTAYKVAYIYQTNYDFDESISYTDSVESMKYVFLSDEDIYNMQYNAYNSFVGFYTDNVYYEDGSGDYGVNVIPWLNEFSDSRYVTGGDDKTYEDLAEDEFYANVYAMGYLGMLEKGKTYSTFTELEGKYYDISFSFNGKTYSKKMKYKTYIAGNNLVAVNKNLYEELLDYFGITMDNIINSKTVKTIDLKASGCKKMLKTLEQPSEICFANDKIINEAVLNDAKKQEFIRTNALYIILLGSIFVFISLYQIIKNEISTYRKLKEKNYNRFNGILTLGFSKVFIYIFIIFLLVIFKVFIAKLLV